MSHVFTLSRRIQLLTLAPAVEDWHTSDRLEDVLFKPTAGKVPK